MDVLDVVQRTPGHHRVSLLSVGSVLAEAMMSGLNPVRLDPQGPFKRTRNDERAREHLTSAVTMYREMDMGFYLEQAEAKPRSIF
jgi:hypothetical protein